MNFISICARRNWIEKASIVVFFLIVFQIQTRAQITISHTQFSTAPGTNDGALCIYLQGSPEVAPFEIIWSNGIQENSDGSGAEFCIDNLAPGDYWVTVRNVYGCEATFFQTIGLCEDIEIATVNIRRFDPSHATSYYSHQPG
jgi:hypothetical protein